MTINFDGDTCTSSPRIRALALGSPLGSPLGLTLGLTLSVSLGGCVLAGIEPDEIDVADDETGGLGEAGDGDGDGDAGNDTGNDDGTTGEATGDGDGDGDGDPAGDGDGDGDGTGDGDGDGDLAPCAEFNPEPVIDGDNAIVVQAVLNNFAGSCGGLEGPDALFVYEASADGIVSFTLSQAEFDGVIYVAGGGDCMSLDELGCQAADAALELDLSTGQTVYVVVDSTQVDTGGAATLTIE